MIYSIVLSPFTQILPHRVIRNGKYLYLHVKISSFNYYSASPVHSIRHAAESEIYFGYLFLDIIDKCCRAQQRNGKQAGKLYGKLTKSFRQIRNCSES